MAAATIAETGTGWPRRSATTTTSSPRTCVATGIPNGCSAAATTKWTTFTTSAQLLHQRQHTPVTVIGHSLGGTISLLYAGLYPETVTRLVSIEGMGPPPSILEERINQPAAKRLTAWIGDLRRIAGRIPRRYKSLEEAYERMQTENPHLTEDQARHLTIHGSNQNEDGTYSWKFDNYVARLSAGRFAL